MRFEIFLIVMLLGDSKYDFFLVNHVRPPNDENRRHERLRKNYPVRSAR